MLEEHIFNSFFRKNVWEAKYLRLLISENAIIPPSHLINNLDINSQLEIISSQNLKGMTPLSSSFWCYPWSRFLFLCIINLGFLFLCLKIFLFFHNDIFWRVSFFIHNPGQSNEFSSLDAHAIQFSDFFLVLFLIILHLHCLYFFFL